MATYKEIDNYVRKLFGRSVKPCWIAHVKELNGLHPRKSHNLLQQTRAPLSTPCTAINRRSDEVLQNHLRGDIMANIPGPQPDVRFCPACKEDLGNVPREKMVSRGHVRKDGTVSPYTHTYICKNIKCGKFEINQDR